MQFIGGFEHGLRLNADPQISVQVLSMHWRLSGSNSFMHPLPAHSAQCYSLSPPLPLFRNVATPQALTSKPSAASAPGVALPFIKQEPSRDCGRYTKDALLGAQERL